MCKMKKVVVIGGTNYDVLAYSHNKLKMYDSNPGSFTTSFGGVGRNIAHNLANLKTPLVFISVIGNDDIGADIILKGTKSGIEFNVVRSNKTSTYIAVHDHDKDMFVAISKTDEMALLTKQEIKKRYHIIKNSSLLVLDTNIEQDTLKYLFAEFDNKICIDVISTQKAKKIIPFYEKIYLLKMNKLEAEFLSGISCDSFDGIQKAGEYFHNKGVKNIFITLGSKGAYYYHNNKHQFQKSVKIETINTTGAGDAFFSGVIYAKINNLYCLKYGSAAAIIKVKESQTVAKALNLDKLKQTIKEYELWTKT